MKNYFFQTYLQTGSLHKTPPYPSSQTQVFGVFPQCPLTHPFMGMHSLQVLPIHPEKQLRLKGKVHSYTLSESLNERLL